MYLQAQLFYVGKEDQTWGLLARTLATELSAPILLSCMYELKINI